MENTKTEAKATLPEKKPEKKGDDGADFAGGPLSSPMIFLPVLFLSAVVVCEVCDGFVEAQYDVYNTNSARKIFETAIKDNAPSGKIYEFPMAPFTESWFGGDLPDKLQYQGGQIVDGTDQNDNPESKLCYFAQLGRMDTDNSGLYYFVTSGPDYGQYNQLEICVALPQKPLATANPAGSALPAPT